MPLDLVVVRIINRLVSELSTELDLHYSDEDMHALHETMDALTEACDLLRAHGHKLPESYVHISDRYNQSGASAKHSH